MSRLAPRRSRRVLLAVTAGLLGSMIALSGCNEIEAAPDEQYEPSSLSAADESGIKTVTLTQLAADRIELATAPVKRVGKARTVPYEALIYDGQGQSWVYTVVDTLTYRRARVTVTGVQEPNVMLSNGPGVGTLVVTRGSTQVYGAELEMAGKH